MTGSTIMELTKHYGIGREQARKVNMELDELVSQMQAPGMAYIEGLIEVLDEKYEGFYHEQFYSDTIPPGTFWLSQ